ncbi:MAG: hypothetical protein AAGN35_23690 [Bacteroidota bacterium]
MATSTTISNAAPSTSAQDYTWLREQGIAHLQELAGDVWTDYNAHDPGVTLLEQLCFAITELGVRSQTSMEDILAAPPGQTGPVNFYTARDILHCRALTLNDYRALIIDCPGILNAWLRTQEADAGGTVGYYAVTLEYESDLDHAIEALEALDFDTGDPTTLEEQKEAVRQYVLIVLHNNRNLCEIFLDDFEEVASTDITFQASLEIDASVSPEEVLAHVWYEIEQLFARAPGFYTIGELQDRGLTTDQIFDGPQLLHGFMDPDELAETAAYASGAEDSYVYASHLTRKIMEVAGILGVTNMLISGGAISNERWSLVVRSGYVPRLDIDNCRDISFTRGSLNLQVDYDEAHQRYKDLKATEPGRKLTSFVDDLAIPTGEYRALDQYDTLQNDFPRIYRIGYGEMPDDADTARVAKARQLKAYLQFFEQLLANFFRQLNAVPELLALDEAPTTTYFHQVTADIPGLPALWAGIDDLDSDYLSGAQSAVASGDLEEIHTPSETVEDDRQNRWLDYLLARFCEDFTDFSLVMYAAGNRDSLAESKRNFLSNYPEISRSRGGGYSSYAHQEYYRNNYELDSDNISGFKLRVASLLGISRPNADYLMPEWGSSIALSHGVPREEALAFVNDFNAPLDELEAVSPQALYVTYAELENQARIFYMLAGGTGDRVLGKVTFVEHEVIEGSTDPTYAEELCDSLNEYLATARTGQSSYSVLFSHFSGMYSATDSELDQMSQDTEINDLIVGLVNTEAPELEVVANFNVQYEAILQEDEVVQLSYSDSVTFSTEGEEDAIDNLETALNTILADIRSGDLSEVDSAMVLVYALLPDMTEEEQAQVRDWYSANWNLFQDTYYEKPQMRTRSTGTRIQLVLVNLVPETRFTSDPIHGTDENDAIAAMDLDKIETNLENIRAGELATIQLKELLGAVYATDNWFGTTGIRYDSEEDLIDQLIALQGDTGAFAVGDSAEVGTHFVELRIGEATGTRYYHSMQLFSTQAEAEAAVGEYTALDSGYLQMGAETDPQELLNFHVIEHLHFNTGTNEGRYYYLSLIDADDQVMFKWPWMTEEDRNRVLTQIRDHKTDLFFDYIPLESSESVVDESNTRYRVDVSFAQDDFVGTGEIEYDSLNDAEAAVTAFHEFYLAVQAGDYDEELLIFTSPHPYNFRLSVLLPDWATGNLADSSYRELVERTLREECPAHLLLELQWVDKGMMLQAETIADAWLAARSEDEPNSLLIDEIAREMSLFLTQL